MEAAGFEPANFRILTFSKICCMRFFQNDQKNSCAFSAFATLPKLTIKIKLTALSKRNHPFRLNYKHIILVFIAFVNPLPLHFILYVFTIDLRQKTKNQRGYLNDKRALLFAYI